MVVKLYKLKMIEGNLGKRIKPRHGPGLIKRTRYNEGSVVHGGPKGALGCSLLFDQMINLTPLD